MTRSSEWRNVLRTPSDIDQRMRIRFTAMTVAGFLEIKELTESDVDSNPTYHYLQGVRDVLEALGEETND
ncbi:MAG: hypothetical protein LLG14_12645 [Nocardiaceae bacterium]|nr:hypothetical protein [Nocardiaceae bacterium]